MSFIASVTCRMGFHEWGEWHYRKAQDCTKIRRCTFCSKDSGEAKVEHTPGSWKYAEGTGDCRKLRLCSRCSTCIDTTVEHRLGDWAYPDDRSCRNIRGCSMCAYIEEGTLHDWGAWQFVEPNHCQQSRFCGRCSCVEQQVSHEQWSEWAFTRLDRCEETSYCMRCGETRVRQTDHIWDSWHYDGPKTCDLVRFCVRCHEKENKRAGQESDHAHWTDWDYAYPSFCNVMEQHCIRCGESRTNVTPPLHSWSEWHAVSSGTEQRKCVRCGYVHERDVKTV